MVASKAHQLGRMLVVMRVVTAVQSVALMALRTAVLWVYSMALLMVDKSGKMSVALSELSSAALLDMQLDKG
jgi:hypothetical protein